jgi:hypothetical protein
MSAIEASYSGIEARAMTKYEKRAVAKKKFDEQVEKLLEFTCE